MDPSLIASSFVPPSSSYTRLQLAQPQYYSAPPAQNGPGMHAQSYPYPTHARYTTDPAAAQMPPPYPPSSHYGAPPVRNLPSDSTPCSMARPLYHDYNSPSHYVVPPSQPNYIVHTDDAATKLNDRVRRKCYNCRTTDTSTWRRSSLTPGKVVCHHWYSLSLSLLMIACPEQLCNKCGLFERTHSRPRPEQFPHKRGPIVTTTFKSSRSPPPSSSRLPPINAHSQAQHVAPAPLPPHHYDHPSIAPLMPRQEGAPAQQSYSANGAPANTSNGNGASNSQPGTIHSLLNGPNTAAAGTQSSQAAPAPQTQGPPPTEAQQASTGNSLKRPLSPSSPGRSPRQEQRTPPYMYNRAQNS